MQWELGKVRVQLAALKLSKGDLGALKQHLTLASQDYRDVLAAAEYPKYSRSGMFHVRELPAKERQRIFDGDWEQYETWLQSSTTPSNEAQGSESTQTGFGSAGERTRRHSSRLGRYK
jgi:hypothetical protein